MGLCSRPGITSCVGIRRCLYCKPNVSGCGACGECASVAFGPMWKGVLMVDVLYVVLCRLPRLLALFGGPLTRFFFLTMYIFRPARGPSDALRPAFKSLPFSGAALFVCRVTHVTVPPRGRTCPTRPVHRWNASQASAEAPSLCPGDTVRLTADSRAPGAAHAAAQSALANAHRGHNMR